MNWLSIYTQDMMNIPSSKIMKLLDWGFLILLSISIFVTGILITIFLNKFIHKNYKEFPNMEFLWTIIPAFILLTVALPSLYTLYFLESKKNQNLSIKVTAHQWYWNYDYLNKFNFDSYLESQEMKNYRILETDNHLILPISKVMMIITSEDVLHSWSLPSLSVKMDANPGRLNSNLLELMLPGIYYGHCSEICGANHTYMPIVLEIVNLKLFKEWFLMKMN